MAKDYGVFDDLDDEDVEVSINKSEKGWEVNSASSAESYEDLQVALNEFAKLAKEGK